MAVLDARSDRIEPRLPFFTPVVATRLSRCWATNISTNGIGLTGYLQGLAPLSRGDELDLEFALGESKQAIEVVGRVTWTSRSRADGRLGFGVQFKELSATARATLARYVAEHRPRALVALASPDEQLLARRALGHLQLDFVSRPAELDAALVGACASIVVFASDEDRVIEFLDALWTSREESTTVPDELPLAPVTLCTSLDPKVLLPLVTAGKIYDVLTLPVDRRSLMLAVDRSCERWALQVELRWASLQLEGAVTSQQVRPGRAPRSPEIIRVGCAMQRVYELIETVAVHDVPVLLAGETGTGKELAARAIHALSRRAHKPFVAQDCGALTETLLESELFGHVRGAFTGAFTDHPGLFQIADGGTIFLDEIQNTSPTLQAKLLRVVEEGEVRPVGSPKARQVDVRLITACNVDLRQAVRDLHFRADFFYRLNRFPLELPPLRDRREDVLPLARHFLELLCKGMDRPVPALEPSVERTLLAYTWPGNIRELRNTIERALLLTPVGAPLRCEVLPDDVRTRDDAPGAGDRGLDSQVEAFERQVIIGALARNGGIVRRTARELAVNAVTLARRMRRLGIAVSPAGVGASGRAET